MLWLALALASPSRPRSTSQESIPETRPTVISDELHPTRTHPWRVREATFLGVLDRAVVHRVLRHHTKTVLGCGSDVTVTAQWVVLPPANGAPTEE